MPLFNVADLPPLDDGNDSCPNVFEEWLNDGSKNGGAERMGDITVGSVFKKGENGWKMPIVPTSRSKSKMIIGGSQTFVQAL